MNRRELFHGAIAGATTGAIATAVALVLGACNQERPMAQWQQDAQQIADSLKTLGRVLVSLDILAPATVERYDAYAAEAVQLLLGAIAAATQDASAPLIAKASVAVENALNTLVLGPVKLPASISTVISAISTLMPLIQVAVGLLAAPPRGIARMLLASDARMALAKFNMQ